MMNRSLQALAALKCPRPPATGFRLLAGRGCGLLDAHYGFLMPGLGVVTPTSFIGPSILLSYQKRDPCRAGCATCKPSHSRRIDVTGANGGFFVFFMRRILG